MRIQRGVSGFYREQIAGRVNPEVEEAIRRTAERFNCSRSFVIAVACADFFGIEVERFNKPVEKKKYPRIVMTFAKRRRA
jgi:hypothetical protein